MEDGFYPKSNALTNACITGLKMIYSIWLLLKGQYNSVLPDYVVNIIANKN